MSQLYYYSFQKFCWNIWQLDALMYIGLACKSCNQSHYNSNSDIFISFKGSCSVMQNSVTSFPHMSSGQHQYWTPWTSHNWPQTLFITGWYQHHQQSNPALFEATIRTICFRLHCARNLRVAPTSTRTIAPKTELQNLVLSRANKPKSSVNFGNVGCHVMCLNGMSILKSILVSLSLPLREWLMSEQQWKKKLTGNNSFTFLAVSSNIGCNIWLKRHQSA